MRFYCIGTGSWARVHVPLRDDIDTSFALQHAVAVAKLDIFVDVEPDARFTLNAAVRHDLFYMKGIFGK